MMQRGLGKVVLALLVVGLSTSGCKIMEKMGFVRTKKHNEVVSWLEAEREQSNALMQDKDALAAENADLRLSNRDQASQLSQREKELAEMRAKLEAKPTTAAGLQEIQNRLNELANANPKMFERNPMTNSLVVRVPFELGSDVVQPAGQAALARAADVLKTTPGNYMIYIDGHTDDLPVKHPKTRQKFTDNWGLGSHRALAVLRTLKSFGINGDQMIARSFADTRPLVNGKTADARRKNRRVEITVQPANAPGGRQVSGLQY